MLGLSVVNGNDGIFELAGLVHAAQADNAGCGLLGAAENIGDKFAPLGVNRGIKVGAIIDSKLGLMVQSGVDVFIIGLVILTFDGVGGDAVLDQRRGYIVLGAERVGGAEN